MILYPCCKINIGLDIIAKREDGFHALESVMVPIYGLHDRLHIERREDGETTFRNEGMEVDCAAEDNICLRAARAMQQRYGTQRIGGFCITLEKKIPFGAGLGGGSSDGTAVILGINELCELHLDESELIEIAATLGSDTALFVRNTPQLCSGRGEIMEAIDLPQLKGKWIAIVKPEGINISTKEAFSGIRPAAPQRHISELIARPIAEWQSSIKNDFEPHIFEKYPTLKEIKESLIEAGSLYAAMSGSGSTIYGIFSSREEAERSSHLGAMIYALDRATR